MRVKILKVTLVLVALILLAAIVYLCSQQQWLEAIAFSGIASVLLWFMTASNREQDDD